MAHRGTWRVVSGTLRGVRTQSGGDPSPTHPKQCAAVWKGKGRALVWVQARGWGRVEGTLGVQIWGGGGHAGYESALPPPPPSPGNGCTHNSPRTPLTSAEVDSKWGFGRREGYFALHAHLAQESIPETDENHDLPHNMHNNTI